MIARVMKEDIAMKERSSMAYATKGKLETVVEETVVILLMTITEEISKIVN